MKSVVIDIIWAVLVAAGVPSVVFGILARRYAKRQDDREDSWIEGITSVLETSNANYHLAKETAKAVMRLDPDKKARNGELDSALDYARAANHRQDNFLRKEAAKRHG
jgi:hypothetical protein